MKKTELKRKTPLRVKKKLESHTQLKAYTGLKCKQKTAKKLKEPYHSIFTNDMSVCYITGDSNNVDPHHIFGGSRKKLSELYGFMIPLRRDWHTMASYAIHNDAELSLYYKLLCQEYYINKLGKTKEEWLSEFGKWYVQKQEEKVG